MNNSHQGNNPQGLIGEFSNKKNRLQKLFIAALDETATNMQPDSLREGASMNSKLVHVGKVDLWLVLGLLVAAFIVLFYWFAYRPSQIRAECAQSVDANRYLGSNELLYNKCLHEKGL